MAKGMALVKVKVGRRWRGRAKEKVSSVCGFAGVGEEGFEGDAGGARGWRRREVATVGAEETALGWCW